MEHKKKIEFFMIAFILATFTMISIGALDPNKEIIKTVSAAKPDNENLVLVQDERFESKVLRFLKQQKVCELTESQALKIKELYDYENNPFDVDNDSYNVIYLKENPLNKNILEKDLGEKFEEKCHLVQGNMMVAMISPIIIS